MPTTAPLNYASDDLPDPIIPPSSKIAAFPLPDESQARLFFNALFKHADPDTYVNLRAFHQTDGKLLFAHGVKISDLRISTSIVTHYMQEAAERKGVYCPPLCSFGNPDRARGADVANSLAIKVELDKGDIHANLHRLTDILGPPTITVASGGKWRDPETDEVHDKLHGYWRLKEPTRTAEDHARVKEACRHASLITKSDPSAIPAEHPLRWPGSWHLKDLANPILARTVHMDDSREIDLSEALEKLEKASGTITNLRVATETPYTGQPQASIEEISYVLSVRTDTPGEDWDARNTTGMAIFVAAGGSDEGLGLWKDWAHPAPPGFSFEDRWKHFKDCPPTQVGIKTLRNEARYCPVTVEAWAFLRENERASVDGLAQHLEDVGGEVGVWALQSRLLEDGRVKNLYDRQMEDSFPVNALEPPRVDEAVPSDKAKRRKLGATPLPEFSNIPPREWLFGNFLCKKYCSSTGAPGGMGKSTYAVTISLSAVTGQDLLYRGEGETPKQFKVHQTCKVWWYCLEDPMEEMLRRIQAAVIHHGLDYEEVRKGLFVDSGRDQPLIVASTDEKGRTVVAPIVNELIETLLENGIGLLIIDPFVSCHNLSENKNEDLNLVLRLWGYVAQKTNCAIWLIHHFRKGGESGDSDAFRGAVAFADACRAMNTLGSMTDEESRKLGVSDYERRFLVRVDDAKHNMSPPAEYAQWFRLVSVNLGNGTNMYPDGDDVQALEPWSPPKTCDGFTWAKVDTILTGIDSGLDNGRLYALGKQSKDRWAGDVIMDQTGWAKERVALILKEWKSVGVFKEATYTLSDGPRKGCREGGVKVNWDVIADAKRASSDIVSFIKPTGNGFTEEDAFGIPTDDDDDDDGMDEAA